MPRPGLLVVFLLVCGLGLGDKLLDLSHDLAEDSIKWPTSQKFKKMEKAKGYTPKGYWYESNNVSFSEHTSTHMDSPNHFAFGKHSVDQIPLEDLIGPAVVIDMSAKAARFPNAVLSTDDVMDWLEEHGPLPDGVVVFVRTGWGSRYSNALDYMGSENKEELVFPGISVGAAQILASYETTFGPRVVGVGIDTASLDPGNSTDFVVHQELFKRNIYGLENVANLEHLPVTGAEVIVMPLKVRGGSGGPCRIVARLPGTSAATRQGATLLVMALPVLAAAIFF